jgi:hypothetical protein
MLFFSATHQWWQLASHSGQQWGVWVMSLACFKGFLVHTWMALPC